MSKKGRVLFVGSFKNQAADGSVGGQMFACRTLINSELKNVVDFILIDTTADSVPPPPPYKRIPKALNRLYLLLGNLFKLKADTAIIFSSSGLSLKEKGLMVILCKMFKVKVIFAPRDGLIKDEIAKSSFTRLFLKHVVKKADIVLCQGKAWQTYYMQFQLSKPDKFKTIRNWIDANKYLEVYKKRTQNGVQDSRPIKLLYLGWLEPYKGISDLLGVFERLIRNGDKIEADIYGSGSLASDINEKVNKLGLSKVFRLRGWANEDTKLKALEEADIFVLPSHREGMPNALIEAMASGLPCISSEVGGVPDLISHKANGLIYEPGDQDGLYENVRYLSNDSELRKSISINAHQFILDSCSVEYAARYFQNMIDTI
ncbi:MAG TPA: glycosyltransferase family 4 protein [Mucilaginibacter sp.]|nr:glycosyltransferase family 4 protein [Mucilaginibacter sp.]